jgi:hypothetical protein
MGCGGAPTLDKLTWTYKEDLPDIRVVKRELEEEQEENLIKLIGLKLWGDLCQMESENERINS